MKKVWIAKKWKMNIPFMAVIDCAKKYPHNIWRQGTWRESTALSLLGGC